MKKNKSKLIWVIIILLIALGGIVYYYIRSNISNSNGGSGTNSGNSTTTTRTATVGRQTITKTVTGSGQIISSTDDRLSLTAGYYLYKVFVSDNQIYKKGDHLLEYTNGVYINAPYDCVIKTISVGEIDARCAVSDYIEVMDVNNLAMTLSINESDLSSISVGQDVVITINANSNQTYTGKITEIDQIGTYASQGSTFNATVSLINDGTIKIGMSASAVVTVASAENVLVVPIEAVQTDNGSKYVVIVNSDESTSNVPVETGLSSSAYVEIKNGLTEGQTVQYTVTTTNNSNRGQSIDRTMFQIPGGGVQTFRMTNGG